MTKRKITDIFEERVVVRKERNEYGEWQEVEKVLHKKRPVGSSSSPHRLIHFFVDGFIISIFNTAVSAYYFVNPLWILNLFPVLIYFAYYILLEFYFQQTIGKGLTGSVVIDEYGEKATLKAICLRTLIRIIPFEPFSFFWLGDNRWWHDTWAKTFVVSKDELALIKRILAGEKPKKSDQGSWDEWHQWQ